ncbi:HAD-IIB family hydrolase [Candidatus Woesearchaeota archaeon]|nr:HAD-IIB family hydrolase [Candidatus Woesearchaeota archaeon]
MKKLVLFDLDNTLAESKSEIDEEMSGLLFKLLEVKEVGIISGGSYEQFQKQLLKKLSNSLLLNKLCLFPTCSTSFYQYNNGWMEIYSEKLSEEEKKKIFGAFSQIIDLTPNYGELLEDRQTQITYSALGQKAPSEIKKKWDPDCKKRLALKEKLEKLIPEFEIKLGGNTSLDITRKGIDKAYGIRKIEEKLGIKKEEIIYIGDALFEGGNDYPVKQAGVDCISVKGPEETKRVILEILKS